MRTASLTVCWVSCWVCDELPLGVKKSRFSTELDPTLNSPGSLQLCDLCLPEPEGQLELLWLPKYEHWRTVSSNLKLPLQIVVLPVSSQAGILRADCWFLPLWVTSLLC